MKYIAVFLTSALAFTSYAQDRPQRGPYNTRPGGVIDGVALQDEVPVRSKVEYEYVRASDVAWQKRVFSRIDAREIMNHDIFLPYDWFAQKNPLPQKRLNRKKHANTHPIFAQQPRHLLAQ